MTKRATTFSALGSVGVLLLGAMALTSAACSGGSDVDARANATDADESNVAVANVANVTFKTSLGGQFLGASAAGAVTATAATAKATETFTVIDRNGGALVSGDLVTIKTSSGNFLQAANGGGTTLNASSANQLDWEAFRIVRAAGAGTVKSGDVVGLQTKTSSMWVSAQNGGGTTVFAYGGAMGPWENLVIGIGAQTPPTAPTSTGTSDGGTTTPPPPPSDGFVHPGIQVSRGQLDFVKAKIKAGEEPWTSAYNAAKKSSYGSLNYTPHPRADVGCGSASNPDYGCTDEKGDVVAAYTQALLYYYSDNEAYAKKAIQIMNAWSGVLKSHSLSNAPLQSAWAASVFPRAADIIRATYTGWAASDVTAFKTMLKNAYLPLVQNGSASNGNWETSMIEASINIGVFLDDKAIFNRAVAMWKKRVPAYIYMTSDGATPVPPPTGSKTGSALTTFWYGQTKYVNGLAQETCRDLGHVQYGLASITNAAETAKIQGQDLYAVEGERLRAGYEFHAQYINGAAVPSWLCGGSLVDASPDAMWEVGYNALVNRRGLSMPATKTLLPRIRPTGSDHMMVWETLTHAAVGNAGF